MHPSRIALRLLWTSDPFAAFFVESRRNSRTANYIADTVISPNVTDLTGSFRLYRKSVLSDLISSVKSKGYFFQPEMIIRARSKGYKIGEVPVTFVDRVFGESKFGAGMIVEWLRVLGGLWWELD